MKNISNNLVKESLNKTLKGFLREYYGNDSNYWYDLLNQVESIGNTASLLEDDELYEMVDNLHRYIQNKINNPLQ